MSIRSMLWHTASVYSKTETVDSSGGLSQGYTLLVGGLNCNVQTPSWRVLETYKQFDESPSAVLYHDKQNLNIEHGDRVVFMSKNYKVIGVTDQLQLDLFFRIDLIKEQI